MILSPVFSRWHEMAKLDDIKIAPDDINYEAIQNMWCFSPSDDDLPWVSEEGLVAMLESLIGLRRQSLLQRQCPAMQFYCWHDSQVRQLRFSLVSALHERLPFGCEIDTTCSLQSIAKRIISMDWLFDSKQDVDTDVDTSAMQRIVRYVCPVFMVRLP